MIENHNDITYLAIKLGIFNVGKLIAFYPKQKIKINEHLASIKIDDVYVSKPYEPIVDPHQIFKQAIKHNDIDMAKRIKNYPVSITEYYLLNNLRDYDNDVTNYIYNDILIKYDPNKLLVIVSESFCELFERIFNAVSDNFDLDCEYLYIKCDDGYIKNIILEYIEEHYSRKKYKKFCRDRC